MIVWCSDSVVEDAVGGKDAATSFIQSDKAGFQDTEVTSFLYSIYLLIVGLLSLGLVLIMPWGCITFCFDDDNPVQSSINPTLCISDRGTEAVVIHGSAGCFCWEWCCSECHQSVWALLMLLIFFSSLWRNSCVSIHSWSSNIIGHY